MTRTDLASAYKGRNIEFRPDRPELKGSLDEVCLNNVKFLHLERMDTNAYWIGAYLKDGRRVCINIWAGRRATIKVNADIESRAASRKDS